MVSCIMPTANRRKLAAVAVSCFLSQEFAECELVILDDGNESIADLVEGMPRVRYFQTNRRFPTLGCKVNRLCELANGEIIATWDDDDWSAPDRLADQVTRLLGSGHPLTGYNSLLFWDGQRASKYIGQSDWPNYAIGASQVYKKDFWREHRFPAVGVGYDGALLEAARGDVTAAPGDQHLVARLHGMNISGSAVHVGTPLWPLVNEDELPVAFPKVIA